MLARQVLRESRQLQESYIEISNYFRGHSRISTRQCGQCPRHAPAHRSLSTSIRRQSANDAKRELAKSARDVTKGFPLPPTSGFAQQGVKVGKSPQQDGVGLEEELGRLGVGVEIGDEPLDPRVPKDMRSILDTYKRRHHLVPDAYPWDFLEYFRDPPAVSEGRRIPVKVYGFITSARRVGQAWFYQLVDPHLRRSVQVVLTRPLKSDLDSSTDRQDEGDIAKQADVDAEQQHSAASLEAVASRNSLPESAINVRMQRAEGKAFKPHTPVLISGHIVQRRKKVDNREIPGPGRGRTRNTTAKLDPFVGFVEVINHLEIHAETIAQLNYMPELVLAKVETNVGPEKRHLQFRIDEKLRTAIRKRSKVMAESRKFLFMKGFDEIETPLLFKSTPEGAREFIVPTRIKGMAYALPQSPQQYKQLLMASGISRYFQFAKCFRDEDMRADRQPEFTQLDLEMSFARREDVMILVERLVAQTIWPSAGNPLPFEKELKNDPPIGSAAYPPDTKLIFPQYTYHQAMSTYGSDKPDPRLGSEIQRVDEWIPRNLKGMLSSLEDPIVEMMKIDMHGTNVKTSGDFITDFLDAHSSSVYIDNPAGAPGITVYDTKKPMNGLASFGHDGSAKVEELLEPEPGDIIIVQARPRAQFTGGSTPLGNLRRELHMSAAAQGLRSLPKRDSFVWITDFPLFSPIEDDASAPGQKGGAGICSTHHPFTAPRSDQDLTKLFTEPLAVIGDHYDLVINGVEVGGGSRRIHDAKMQEAIFSHVLRMSKKKIEEFRHLLNALESGCPPHAGFALGFDRLMALALGRGSVRDVIAFPKWGGGEDRMVGSPSNMSDEALETYHLRVNDCDQARAEQVQEKVSKEA